MKHAGRMARLWSASCATSTRSLATSWTTRAPSAAFAALLDEPRLGQVWLIEHGPAGDVVGYVVVTFVFAMEFGGRVAVVDDFYVRPEARGDGLGKAAIAAVRRACEELGVRAMRVEVGAENAVARAVYRSAGFTELKDHRLMTLPLAPPSHRE